jgi:integrase
MNRPTEWKDWNIDQRMAWLRGLRTQSNGGRRPKLTVKDKERVWALVRRYENKSLAAEMLGVSRSTIIRFLKHFPIPDAFQVEKKVEDYSEIKIWINRQRGFSKEYIIKDNYLPTIQKFHNYQKRHHPERTRPRLWNSDDVLEWVQTFEPYQQHNAIVPLRQLAKKAPKEFPLIDLGLLPTRKTHKAKRSLAGKQEYYLTTYQIKSMIKHVPNGDGTIEARNQAIIALLFNIACRTGNANKGKGLLGILIENLDLKNHRLLMQDKGDIWWNILGLTDATIQYLRHYLKLRGKPKAGFLFVDENGAPMKARNVNDVIEQAGMNAGITGKKLVAKTFRKSFVKYALEERDMNPACLIGTGKQTKTCFCVGWSNMKVLMEHYAPKLVKQIEKDRHKFPIEGEMD